jgi:hypothetical protein
MALHSAAMKRLTTPLTVGDAYAPLFTTSLPAANLPEEDRATLVEATRHYGMANRVEVVTDRGAWVFTVRAHSGEGTPEEAFLLASAGQPREDEKS